MKKVKKLLALVLSLAMAMSLVVAPQAGATAPVLVATASGSELKILVLDNAPTEKQAGYAGYILSDVAKAAFNNQTIKTFQAEGGAKQYVKLLASKNVDGSGDGLFGTGVGVATQPVTGPNGTFTLSTGAAVSSSVVILSDDTATTPLVSSVAATGNIFMWTGYGALIKSSNATVTTGLAFAAVDATNNVVIAKNQMTGVDQAMNAPYTFTATLDGLMTGFPYAYEIKAHYNGVDYLLKSDTFNPATDLYVFNTTWDGKVKNGGFLPKGDSTVITYSILITSNVLSVPLVSQTVAAHNYGYANSGLLNYEIVKLQIPDVTPGKTNVIGANLVGYDKNKMDLLKAVIYDGDSLFLTQGYGNGLNNVLAILDNKGTDNDPVFEWNGKYTHTGSQPTYGVPLQMSSKADKSRFVDKTSTDAGYSASYGVAFISNSGTVKKDGARIKVGTHGTYLFTGTVSYKDTNGTNAAFLDYNAATKSSAYFNVESSAAYVPYTVKIIDNLGETIHTLNSSTGAANTDGKFLGQVTWDGTLADGSKIAYGTYRVEISANVADGNTIDDGKLIVGLPVRVTSMVMKDSVITVGAGNAFTDAEVIFTPSTATTKMIDKIELYQTNKYWEIDTDKKNYTDYTIRILGKQFTDSPVSAIAKVTFMDGTTVDLKLNVKVTKASTSLENVSSIFREAAGTTGKKITFDYLPAGTTGEMPTFYVVEEDANGKLTKVTDDKKLAEYNAIATVNAKGEVTFKAPGRVLYGTEFGGVTYKTVICTTTEFVQFLYLYPLDGEVTINAGLTSDASKQPRVAGYARPVWLADETVTYKTSDRTAVYFRHAAADSDSITNKTVVPAGAHNGAIVGVEAGAEAKITATTSAKTTDGETLSEELTVKVK